MDIKSQALALETFLNQYTLMWNDEIMNQYPDLSHYPEEWITLLHDLCEQELYAIDCKQSVEKIKDTSFSHFMQKARELSFIPEIEESPELVIEQWAFNGVKEKKRHEIQKIVPVLKKAKEMKCFEYVVDIGGGVGHLSRVLSHYHSIPSISLDRNREFQKIGEARLAKYRRLEGSRDVRFVNINFGEKTDEECLKTIFTPEGFNLGLHTCGPLARTVIEKTIEYKTKGLLSFGCCYYLLNPKKDFPLSQHYKENHSLKWTTFGLTLATRSHAEMTFSTYQTKERVKYYRYALHLFLIKHFDNKHFNDVGECPVKTYWGPFADYAREKLEILLPGHTFTNLEFEDFYNDPATQQELRRMWLCNIIRWQLGRALEVYLLLDRYLYLEEKGFEVKIEQYFKEALSPRNIGILALLK